MPPKLLPEGIYAAALTPLDAELRCNSTELAAHCRDLLQRGCTGIALFGTTGEGPSFSVQERMETIEQVIAKGLDPQVLIIANGSSGITDTVALAKAAQKLGCAAMLIAPPCFYKNVPEAGVVAFYREVIQRVADPTLRVILYHIPQFSGVPITMPIVDALRHEFPRTIIGIKESEGNLALTKAFTALPGFQVFVGNERHIIEAVHHGAAGSICGIGNLYPELLASLYAQGKQGLRDNPPELDAIFDALRTVPFIPAAKAVMQQRRGPAWHAVRPPFVPLERAPSVP